MVYISQYMLRVDRTKRIETVLVMETVGTVDYLMNCFIHGNFYTSGNEVGGGILDSPCPPVRLTVRPSVDDIVSGA